MFIIKPIFSFTNSFRYLIYWTLTVTVNSFYQSLCNTGIWCMYSNSEVENHSCFVYGCCIMINDTQPLQVGVHDILTTYHNRFHLFHDKTLTWRKIRIIESWCFFRKVHIVLRNLSNLFKHNTYSILYRNYKCPHFTLITCFILHKKKPEYVC